MLDIYVINLEERKDKWFKINQQFGNKFNLIRVDAVKHNNGHIGCFHSHKKCLTIAKEKGLKNIIVIEDDCIENPGLNGNFENRLNNLKDFLDNYEEWDIFLGAGNEIDDNDIIKKIDYEKEHILQIKKSAMTHFMIYNSSCYEFFLNQEITGIPIDRIWYNKLRALILVPFLAYQSNGMSDINNINVNYYRKIKNTENRLLKYINKI